jgi:hypothetical protein
MTLIISHPTTAYTSFLLLYVTSVMALFRRYNWR